MTSLESLAIVGTGLAGYTLAREWRKLDKERPLVMLTEDDGSFYSKPMLSNALAQGKTPESLALKSAAAMARELDADIRPHTRVDGLDPATQTLTANGERLPYGDLVIATGASPIRIPVAGDGADHMLSVNNLADYSRLRELLGDVRSVAVMGPGLIGCELANDLASQDIAVDVLGPDPWPIASLLPEPAGHALQTALARVGIRFHLGTTARRIDLADSGYRLELEDGSVLQAELVLSAVGLRPDTRLARAAGLETNRGIVTDRFLRTSDPHIFALGDCAEVAGLNLPYVMPIMHGARAMAKTLAGDDTEVTYPAMPVAIKTPALATVVAPPPPGAAGEWETSGDGNDIRAIFGNADSPLLGFALTGAAVGEKQTLTQALPPVL